MGIAGVVKFLMPSACYGSSMQMHAYASVIDPIDP